MNRQSRLAPLSKTHPVRRLRSIAAAALLAITATATILALAIPSLAQADPSAPEAVDIILVDTDATGAETGETWEDAYTNLHDAITAAVGAEIWVAEGIYYPDEGIGQTAGDRTSTFRLKQGVTIYGGFVGTENLLEQRDWENNITVLSGDLGKNDTVDANGVVTDPAKIVGTDNAYHVVAAEDVMVAAKLNGFIVTAGLADSTSVAANHSGAGIYNRNAAPTLANLIVQGNRADGELAGLPAGDGGGMYNFSGGPQFSNVTFRNNFAQNGGGLYTTDSAGAITNLTLHGNEAGTNGGGIYLTTSLGHSLSNLTFTGNSAGDFGGGLYVESGVQSSLGNSSFTANTAVSGGGLYVSSSVLNLTSLDFEVNEATDYGGGMFVQLSTYSLTDVTFDGNEADSAGGGVYADSNAGTMLVSVFTDNTSALGAGMYVDDQLNEYTNLAIDSTLFVHNLASQDGGGLYVVNSSEEGTLDSVSFLYNEAAGGNGGGMFLLNSSGYELLSTDFIGNDAISGGGLFVETSSPTLTDVRFEDNRAQLTYVDDTLGGGGIYLVDGSDATISSAAFSGNEAANGGGMFIGNSNPTLTNVSFSGNQAGDGISGSGGGLWNYEGSPTLINVLFGGNASTQDGGGMLSGGGGSNVTIINATFSGNAAGGSGGGLNTTSPNMTIHNTVVWNNQDSTGIGTADASIWDDPDSMINYSLIQGQVPAGIGNLDGTNAANNPQFVVAADPATAPTSSGILSVKYGSPIVDVGDNTMIPAGVTLDLAGNPRIYNSIVDMGAYELQLACPPPETTRLYVDHTAGGNNTGTSWLDALEDLRDAFTLADDCAGIVEVWVAQGVYHPDQGVGMVPNTRTETYQLIDGVAIYGGFNGTEALLEERDWRNQPTVLSGDISGDNSYHVVIASGVGSTAILDGFTLTAGQADGNPLDHADLGAGLYNDASSPTLANLTFTGNFAESGAGLANVNSSNPPIMGVQFQSNTAGSFGGAIYNKDSAPSLTDIQFQNNAAGSSGGAIYNKDCDAALTDVQFQSNTAGSFGGAIYNEDSDPSLTNALLSGNTASDGAAIYNKASHPSLTNALLSGNSAGTGAAIHNTASNPILVNVTVAGNRASGSAGGMFNTSASQPTVHNSIFWDNQDGTGTGTASATIHNDDLGSIPLINYSLVQTLSGINHTGGTKNLDKYPWFTTPLDPSAAPTTGGDLTLGIFSPAIDVGDDAANSTLADLAGNPRKVNDIDLGAYEAPIRPVYDLYLPALLRNYP